MCGIAGFAGLRFAEEEAKSRLRAMCDAIQHRGPDSAGYFVSDDVALGMRRLSIIDIAGGQQPIANEDGAVTVVFNGEIYNHRALRQQLEAGGHRFKTRSDTEVLVHLYEEHGAAMASRLHGMFAFAIWDARKKVLLIARDRTGMKPLSYRQVAGGLLFGSELRSLWVFDPQALRVAPESVMRYLAFGYVPDPDSIFCGVRKLPPGHLLLWSPGREIEIRKYWEAPLSADAQVPEPELVEQLREKLDHAVSSHLESEVPLGAFLSGGLDSSTVVALMCRHATGRVRTFSIGFEEKAFDESSHARSVATELGTEHTELIVRPDVEEVFELVAGIFDEPFGDSSAIPTLLVARLARQQVTVALSGDGGDELFGGYSRYQEVLGQWTRHGPLSRMLGGIGQRLPHVWPGRNRLIDLGRSRRGRYASTVLQPVRMDEGGVAAASQPGSRVTIDEQLSGSWSGAVDDDFADAMTRVDLQTYLPGDILTKVDRASMAVSLEARVPLLEAGLVDFALSLPGQLRVTKDETKYLFRKAIRGIVPNSVLTQPKRGFAVPLGQWFRGPLRHRVEGLRSAPAEIGAFVDGPALRRLASEHLIGRRDHSGLLWRLLVLDYWMTALKRGQLGRPPSLPGLGTGQ